MTEVRTPSTPVVRAGAVDDETRRRGLVRMKSTATVLLLVAAAIWVLLGRWQASGAPGWVGYAKAAAEAGMIGGLADWFAVTALFRHPLGLPIPHTAIIPTRKNAIGATLGSFVGANFLSAPVVREKLRSSHVARRVGAWLAEQEHAERVTSELSVVARGVTGVLGDEELQATAERALSERLAVTPLAPPLGRLLARIVEDGAHRGVVDVAAGHAYEWLARNRETILDAVVQRAPTWSPRILDEKVADRVHTELLRLTREVWRDPEHALRRTLDRWLLQLATDMQKDESTRDRVDRLLRGLIEHPDARRSVRDLLSAARRYVLDLLQDPDSELRQRIVRGVRDLGTTLAGESDLAAKVDGWIEDAVAHVVESYRDEITGIITDTVESWDAEATSRKIELQVGRDLQFIRINGTVVGAAAGLVIYSVGQLIT